MTSKMVDREVLPAWFFFKDLLDVKVRVINSRYTGALLVQFRYLQAYTLLQPAHILRS
ncbi:MAG: hypothetical protein HGA87_02740 [Desulfobulbaceae bacterium]|nr:hypothetical protein [Desulfobulbaceae bacterium]